MGFRLLHEKLKEIAVNYSIDRAMGAPLEALMDAYLMGKGDGLAATPEAPPLELDREPAKLMVSDPMYKYYKAAVYRDGFIEALQRHDDEVRASASRGTETPLVTCDVDSTPHYRQPWACQNPISKITP